MSPIDRFADLLHVSDDQNESIFEESDIERIELELFPEKTSESFIREMELELFRREQLKNTSHPLELMDTLSHDVGFLKEAFEGMRTGVLKPKDQEMSWSQLAQLAQTMSKSSKDKVYEPFIDENQTRFLVESTLGVSTKFQVVEDTVKEVILPHIAQILQKAGYGEDFLNYITHIVSTTNDVPDEVMAKLAEVISEEEAVALAQKTLPPHLVQFLQSANATELEHHRQLYSDYQTKVAKKTPN